MWPESKESKKNKPVPKLRTGLTTGSCATACCVAAAYGIFHGVYDPRVVTITLPSKKKGRSSGKQIDVGLPIFKIKKIEDAVVAYTIKDAGDDPDVTHGATVWVALRKTHEKRVRFSAGQGVGTVTKAGLALEIGEPAINPVPRQMMIEHLQSLSVEFGYEGCFDVTVGVEGGASLALKTMNPRLGIQGGLSILGTSGIVRPFSCSAYIASIHQGVDVALTNGESHIAASTGNQSENAIRGMYVLKDMAMIEMGDFVGALLKHIRARYKQGQSVPEKLSICAGFGKLTKLAEGHMDLHSRASQINFDNLSKWVKQVGGDTEFLEKVESANTSVEVLKLCQQQGLGLADLVCQLAREKIYEVVPKSVLVEVFAINRQGKIVGSVK